jgi:cyclophilin family peptidyl-prolyl cis-trans isomerase
MGTAKRERQKQGRQARIEAAIIEQKRRQRRKTARNIGIVAVLMAIAIFVLSRQFSGDDKTAVTATGSDASSAAPGASATTAVPPVSITVPAPGASITGDTPCPAADNSSPRTTTFAKAPPMCIDPAKTYTATVSTSKGDFAMSFDTAAAPNTVNNFIVLARYHFYDGVAFHRIIPGFVVQGGDATGPSPGAGGPGYTINDELPTGAAPFYPLQSVAMANSGPNTNGSQFFIVTGDQGVSLPASYTRFASVTTGFDVVQQIEAVGTAGDGTPTEVVTINSVTITES